MAGNSFQNIMRAAGVATARMRRELAPGAETPTEITVSLDAAELAAVDAWIAAQPDPKPSRGEAARTLIAVGLKKG